MASQPEGSNPHSPLEGWTFLDADSESEFSNSSSLEELFEQNRLHLTVNPLDPFLPTIRPTHPVYCGAMLSDAPQYTSSLGFNTDNHDAAAETRLGHPDDVPADLNSASAVAEFRLEDHFEADVLVDSSFVGRAAPGQVYVSSQQDLFGVDNAYDFPGIDSVADLPTDNEFYPELNQAQADQGLADPNTFDADFWFSFPTEVDTGSPLPPGVFNNNAYQILYPRVPEEVYLQERSMSSLADLYGYSELLAQPVLDFDSDHLPADDLLTYGNELFHRRPISIPQVSQALQQDLPEPNFSDNPVVDCDGEAVDISQPPEQANSTTAPSTLSATEESGPSASSSTSSSPARGDPEPSSKSRRSQECLEQGARRQREAASRTPNPDHQRRLARRRENHRQHRDKVQEGVLVEREHRRLHGPRVSRPALTLTIPRNLPSQQGRVVQVVPAPVVLPGQIPLANASPTAGDPVVRVRVATPVPAGDAANLLPPTQDGQAPMHTSTVPTASAIEDASESVIYRDNNDSSDAPPRPEAPSVQVSPPPPLRRSERLRSRVAKKVSGR